MEIEDSQEPQRRSKKVADAYRRIFDCPDGDIVLKDLCKRAGMGRTTFVQGDPYMSAFNEGQRNAVLTIFNLAKVNMDKLIEIKTQMTQNYEDTNQ